MYRLLIFCFVLITNPLVLRANCVAPSLLAVAQVTDSTANLTWTDVGDAYELELRLVNESFTGVPTHAIPGDPPFTLSALVPGEQYKFRVRTVCAGGGFSLWSLQRTFATQLNNERPCPLDFTLRDTTCSTTSQFFALHTNNAPGNQLGTNVFVKGLRLVLSHPWRSDLRIWLHSPDGTRIQVVGGLNAGDQNLGNPTGNGNCGQYLELTDDASAPLLSAAAEQDNITGFWRALNPLTGFHTGQNPNGLWQLEICDSKLNHTGKLRLVQLIFEAAECPAPTALLLSNVQINGVDVAWDTSMLQSDTLEIVYGPKGFTPETGGTALLVSANAPQPITLSNLAALQQYDVFVRQRCTASGVWSGFSAPATFFTVCPAEISESFDNLNTCPTGCTDPCPLPGIWQNMPGDDYEWKVRSGAGITWPTAGPSAASGGSGNYLFFRNSCTPSGANGRKAILRTRCLDISAPAGPPCHFSLDIYMNTKLGQMGSLSLEGSTDGGQTWQTIQTWSGNRGKQWRREFVNLAAYDGQTALFQLTATGVFGAYGDIALDNLVFYGATPAGTPDYFFFRDADADGFGSTTNRIISCSPMAPAGYITIAGDCNDNNAAVNPNAAEITCNGVDDNCNGTADDSFIPAPVVVAAPSVCRGEAAEFSIGAPARGQYFWFDAPTGGQLLATGTDLTVFNVQNNLNVWVVDSFATGGCASARTPVSVNLLEKPDLELGFAPEICFGTSLLFNSLPINDIAQTTGNLTFHNGWPVSSANQINGGAITPIVSTFVYAQKLANNGCADVIVVGITVHELPFVAITNGDSLAFCKGKTIDLMTFGSGDTPLNYQWSNGFFQKNVQITANGTGFSTTTYTVTITDANGCTAKDAIKITSLPGVSQTNVTAVQNVGFCGGNNGSISLQALDGNAPYTFQWSGPNQTTGAVTGVPAGGGTIGGLTQGGYRITVTDATGLGCSMVLPSLVLNAPGLTVSAPVITHPLCPGGTGSISVTAQGTTPAFLWSNSATTNALTAVPAGTYSVTVTDGACQQIIPDLKITAPAAFQILSNKISAVRCNGNSDGGIDITVTGGTAPYSYLWNDLQTTADRTGLSAGNYRVTITDANGCTAVSAPLVVTTPAPLQTTGQITPVRCFGGSDGAISLAVQGGMGPYFTEWSTGAFALETDNLAAGTYTVSVVDAQQCPATQTFTVAQPPALQITLANAQNPTCAGKTNGSLAVQVNGGAGNYQLIWNNGANTTALQNLEDGTYAVSVTDANGCTAESTEFQLIAPQVIQFLETNVAPVACFGGNSGSIDLSLSSTNTIASLTMNGENAVFPKNFLLAGDYLIEVIDALGCAADTLLHITEPAQPLSLNVVQVVDIPCHGTPSGTADIITAGGTAPYTYLWDNGSTTEDLDAAVAGNYALITTDANGCQAGILDIIISEPPPLSVTPYIEPINCLGAPFGRIVLSVNGGAEPYTYQWSSGATTATLFDAPAGQYSVSIFDQSGCLTVYDSMVVLDKKQDFSVELIQYQPVSCNSGDDGTLTVKVLNGTAPYQYSWSAPVGLHANISSDTDVAGPLKGGQYQVTVTDAAGCFRSAGPFLVEEAPPVLIQTPPPAPIACKGTATGTITATAVGGVPPLSYNWSNGTTGTPATDLTAGVYMVTATDVRGCTTVSAAILLTEPETALAIVTDEVLQDACSDGGGAIFTTGTGGYPDYQYTWSIPGNSSDVSDLLAGTYSLTITDQQGCSSTQTWTLQPQPNPMSLGSYSVVPVACKFAETGALEVGISGGNLPLSYFWSNGGTTANISGLAAGNYRVTVQDNEGCLKVFEVPAVTEPDSILKIAYTSEKVNNNYHVTIFCSGGTPGYTFEWDMNAGNQTGATAFNLPEGYYSVTITDAGGCVQIVSVYASTSDQNNPVAGLHAVTLSPNPARGNTQVRFQLPAESGGQWQLLAPDGHVTLQGSWEKDATQIAILGENLANGVYLVHLLDEKGQSRWLKWVKSDW